MIKGITFGAFDLLHTGHLLMFKEAKGNCDELIVGLHVDPSCERKTKNKPVESMFERFVRLNACRYVDKIIPYETESEILAILEMVKPHKRFIGEEYIGKDFTAKDWEGYEIHYTSRKHNYSSTNLRKLCQKSR